MSLIPYYLQYLSEICEGTRQAPEGLALSEQDDLKKALQLQAEISRIGIPAFVRACAEADGTEIAQEEYDSFDPAELNAAIAQLASAAQPQPEKAPEEAPQEPVKTETRDIFEVFLDSVCLDENLLVYLIDILKRHAEPEFTKLSHAAARTELKLDDFLAWLGNKELWADDEERVCAAVMDACLERLRQEGRLELLARLRAHRQARGDGRRREPHAGPRQQRLRRSGPPRRIRLSARLHPRRKPRPAPPVHGDGDQ